MGLLDQGTPLSWADSQPFIEYVKKHGLLQFINIYKTLHEVETDKFLWGDEIEYCIVQLDPLKKTCKLLLKGKQVQADLDHAFEDLKESDAGEISSPRVATFHPEYAMYMIEGTPGFPYEGFTADLRLVEPNMELRRSLIQNALEDNEFVVSCTSFPLLGFESFCLPWVDEKDGISGPAANSLFVPDSVINDHPRFPCLTQNIRQRRGSKVDIRIPLFKDVYTESRRERETRDCETISMDCMAFGMGCCCLQVTFQARSINDARMLYDQLAVMTPIMLAATAASPFFKGEISDFDVRWTVISQSVDDRTPEERETISKSRYDSISLYISQDENFKEQYNDLSVVINEEAYLLLRKNGIDHNLARHIAHLWIRDPLVIFKETLEVDDSVNNNHFENIQSTNWQTMRFKPPHPRGDTGWRVEFRSMESQLTDFENAAFTVFVALLGRAILFFKLNLYLPLSLVDENMRRAHVRSALTEEKFFFRKHIRQCDKLNEAERDSFEEMTVLEILCGKGCYFPGLIPVMESYLDVIKCDHETRRLVDRYFQLIKLRAEGKLMTNAMWMRRYVSKHPSYKKDSALNQEIVHDLFNEFIGISGKKIHSSLLFGDLYPMSE